MENSKWKISKGEWEFKEKDILQKNYDKGFLSRCYSKIKLNSFIISVDIIMENIYDSWGEAKLIFSNANKNENFRVDLIFGQDFCRVVADKKQYFEPATLTNKINNLKILVFNNFISVKINEFLIHDKRQFGKLSDGNIGLGTYQAKIKFKIKYIKPFEKKKAVIIMPYDEKRNFIYDDVVEPCLKTHPEFEFDYYRADKSLTTGQISDEIKQKISNADIIIADITVINPNVYYELGFSDAKIRKVILISQEIENLPFDIRHERVHQYTFSRQELNEFKEKLKNIISNVL